MTSTAEHGPRISLALRLLTGLAILGAVLQLPLLAFGYLFFFGSFSPGMHLYVWSSAAALLFTIASPPLVGQHRFLLLPQSVAVLLALPMGLWQIWEQLNFFQGPAYGAALFNGGIVLVIVMGWFCAFVIVRAHRASAAASTSD